MSRYRRDYSPDSMLAPFVAFLTAVFTAPDVAASVLERMAASSGIAHTH
jgi:hypothetical protein